MWASRRPQTEIKSDGPGRRESVIAAQNPTDSMSCSAVWASSTRASGSRRHMRSRYVSISSGSFGPPVTSPYYQIDQSPHQIHYSWRLVSEMPDRLMGDARLARRESGNLFLSTR